MNLLRNNWVPYRFGQFVAPEQFISRRTGSCNVHTDQFGKCESFEVVWTDQASQVLTENKGLLYLQVTLGVVYYHLNARVKWVLLKPWS